MFLLYSTDCQSIANHTFASLLSLKELDLRYNGAISYIGRDAFNGPNFSKDKGLRMTKSRISSSCKFSTRGRPTITCLCAEDRFWPERKLPGGHNLKGGLCGCPPGQQLSDRAGIASCQLCERGKYSSSGETCVPCDATRPYTGQTGSTSDINCTISPQAQEAPDDPNPNPTPNPRYRKPRIRLRKKNACC